MHRSRTVLAALVAAVPALGLMLVNPGTAAAAPNFQMPFACGYTATAATFSGHSPANAVDFQKSGITGTPVLSSAPGTVSRVANEGSTSYGRWVEVDHGGGWTTRYAHLSVQSVSVGQSVGQGTKLGEAGATGGVTGPHLHFEERSGGVAQKVKLNGVAVPYYAKTSFTSKNNCGGNPYSATQVCGSGYSVVDSAKLGSAGTVYLLYNSGSKSNCVTTLKATSVGKASAASSFLEVQGQSRVTDSGNYTYYAGPVRKAAGSTCVKWGGSVGSQSYASGFEHCG